MKAKSMLASKEFAEFVGEAGQMNRVNGWIKSEEAIKRQTSR